MDHRLSGLLARLIPSLARRPPPTRFDLPGIGPLSMHLHQHSDLYISDPMRRGHVLEPFVLDMLQTMTEPGDTLLDIGANLGWFTVIASRLVGPNGHVVAVEPARANLALLRRNLRANACGNVTLHACAAGATDGTAQLHLSPDSNQGDHRMALASDRRSTPVAIRRLDTLLPKATRIDVIKMDTQGSEAHALAGLRQTLAASPRARLVLEYWPHGLHHCGSTPAGLLAELTRRPSVLWLLGNDGRLARAAPDALLADATYSPAGQAFADLVVASADDAALIERMDARCE